MNNNDFFRPNGLVHYGMHVFECRAFLAALNEFRGFLAIDLHNRLYVAPHSEKVRANILIFNFAFVSNYFYRTDDGSLMIDDTTTDYDYRIQTTTVFRS